MRTEVVGRDVTVTDELLALAESKADKLTRYFDLTQLITFTLSRESAKTIKAECIVDVEHHDDFVATAEAETARAAIDAVVDKAARQLSDFKEKLKAKTR